MIVSSPNSVDTVSPAVAVAVPDPVGYVNDTTDDPVLNPSCPVTVSSAEFSFDPDSVGFKESKPVSSASSSTRCVDGSATGTPGPSIPIVRIASSLSPSPSVSV